MPERRELINPGSPVCVHGRSGGVTSRLQAFEAIAALRGQRLLDLGCGNGAYTVRLAERFERVDAVDPATAHLADFRKLFPKHGDMGIRISEMRGEDLAFEDAAFDAVTCIEVLEHVESVVVTLAEIWRVLKPGGVLAVSVPNRLFPVETHMVQLGGRRYPGKRLPFLPYVPALHSRISEARTFTHREIRRLVTEAGFREVGNDYVMPPFDGWDAGYRFIRPVASAMSRTPLRRFGVSVIVVARKTTW